MGYLIFDKFLSYSYNSLFLVFYVTVFVTVSIILIIFAPQNYKNKTRKQWEDRRKLMLKAP